MKNTDKTLPFWIWFIYPILFLFSIPWYLPLVVAMNLVLLLPFSLVCNILAIFLMACFTVWVSYKLWG